MKSRIFISILSLIIIFYLYSCDFHSGISVVKNDRANSIYVTTELDSLAKDSAVATNYINLQQYNIDPKSFKVITVPGKNLSSTEDSVKRYLYIFDADSLNKYEKVKYFRGILKQSLIKIIRIQFNKIRNPLDTIYIK